MKTYLSILIICAGLLLSSCNQNKGSNDKSISISEKIIPTLRSGELHLVFEKKEHDFETVDGNDKNKEFVRFDFEFTNEREKPIII